jgi:5,10-methylenetetrahydromethanopterin reductase
LDDLAPNRVICGIGAWWDPLAKNVGIDRKKPLTAMKETVLILRRLLNMERVTFEGEFIHVNGIELDVVHGRREPRHVPIMIGATGDQMMELAGEIADGVVLNYCAPPEHNDHTLDLLEKGAVKSGRSLEDIDRPQLIVCSVEHDHDKAIDSTRGLLCQYLAQQPHIAKASGVSEEIVKQIQSILGWPATEEQIDKAKHLIPDDLIDRITASGTPEEARCCVNEYRKHGCTCPILYPVCGDVKLLVDTFAQ